MVTPKTDSPPPSGDCCDIEITTLWSATDRVPNQGLGNPEETEEFWERYGRQYNVDPRANGHPWNNYRGYGSHDFWAYFFNPLPVIDTLRQGLARDSEGRRLPKKGWRYFATYDGMAPSGMEMVSDWMSDQSLDNVFVCHSQGCNILLQQLQRACSECCDE